jgi:hypothetical protein
LGDCAGRFIRQWSTLIIYAIPAFVLRKRRHQRDLESSCLLQHSFAPSRPPRRQRGLPRPQLPTRVAFHEFIDLARDVRGARNWRERFGYVFRGPGWSPDGNGGGTRE